MQEDRLDFASKHLEVQRQDREKLGYGAVLWSRCPSECNSGRDIIESVAFCEICPLVSEKSEEFFQRMSYLA